MNTLLHLADSVLQYHRGKQVGLWGLIGIALGILAVAIWDKILPFFEFIGLVDFFDNLGILHANAPYMSAFKIVMFFFMASIAFMVLGWIALGIFAVVMEMAQNSIMQKLYIGLVIIALSPVLIIMMLYYLLMSKSAREEMKLKRNDPEAYKELKRLAKNKRQIDYLKFGPNGDKDNTISYEEAYDRLNRLPTFGDHLYLIGVTYDREIYMLLPGPIQANLNSKTGEVHTEQLETSIQLYGNNGRKHLYKLDMKLVESIQFREYVVGMSAITLTDIEEFIDPSNIKEVDSFYREYNNSKFYYSIYVPQTLTYFFKRKDKIIEDIQVANTAEEYKSLYNELQNLTTPNEDIVKIIWETHKAKEKEELERISKHSIY